MRTKVGIPLAHHFLTEPLRAGNVPVIVGSDYIIQLGDKVRHNSKRTFMGQQIT